MVSFLCPDVGCWVVSFPGPGMWVFVYGVLLFSLLGGMCPVCGLFWFLVVCFCIGFLPLFLCFRGGVVRYLFVLVALGFFRAELRSARVVCFYGVGCPDCGRLVVVVSSSMVVGYALLFVFSGYSVACARVMGCCF